MSLQKTKEDKNCQIYKVSVFKAHDFLVTASRATLLQKNSFVAELTFTK